jgi:hypothetical protein
MLAPLELLDRLAALIPSHRAIGITHGVFAPDQGRLSC